MENKPSVRQMTRKIIQTALFISLALVIRNFSTMVYFMGAPGMRIGLTTLFSRIPAIIFGPFYGGIAGGIADVLGYLIKPEGAYLPLMTVSAIIGGVIAGFVWKWVKNFDLKRLQRILWIIFISIGVIGLFNYINTSLFPDSFISTAIAKAGKYKDFLTLGLIAVSLIGLALLAINYAILKKFPNAPVNKYYLKILLAYGLSGITVTVINTLILTMYIPSLAKIGFSLLIIPRIVEEILMTVIQSYLAAFLISIYERIIAKMQRE